MTEPRRQYDDTWPSIQASIADLEAKCGRLLALLRDCRDHAAVVACHEGCPCPYCVRGRALAARIAAELERGELS